MSRLHSTTAGLGLFQGPHLAGKSTIIREYVRRREDELSIAVVNGEGLTPATLLESILRGFGFQHKFDSVNELLNMVTVFCKQQTASGQAPLLFIENTHTMGPAALNIVSDLACLRVREKICPADGAGQRPVHRVHRQCPGNGLHRQTADGQTSTSSR